MVPASLGRPDIAGRRVSVVQSADPFGATGDAKLQADGNSEKVAGNIQNIVGGIKDTIKDAAKSNS